MTDNFDKFSKGLESPADEHFNITPDDNNDLLVIPRVIYVHTGGTLTLVDKRGVSAEYNPADNSYILFRAVRVMSAGTTATGLVGKL